MGRRGKRAVSSFTFFIFYAEIYICKKKYNWPMSHLNRQIEEERKKHIMHAVWRMCKRYISSNTV